MNEPPLQPGSWPTGINPGRWAARVTGFEEHKAEVALLGMPDDTGVGLNGGRLGAALGPAAIREALARYGAAEAWEIQWPSVCDAGDVMPAGDDLRETHARVTRAVRTIMEAGMIPVGLGGGHDLTFPFVRGVAEFLADQGHGSMHGVYFDAHLDVREEEGSGMPFRRLLEGGYCQGLEVHGFDAMANSAEHTRWFLEHGGRIDTFGPEGPWPQGEVFVSFDLDVIDQSCAPGVSAMNPSGWTSELACRWAHSAGRCERVRCFDVMELCPPNDSQGRTARLAARLILEFMRGLSERGASS